MKKYIIYFVLFISFKNFSFCQDSLSTDYPFLYKVKANCSVSYDENRQMYYYNYVLFNDVLNRGSISDFLIDISRQSNTVLYDTIGLRFDSNYEEGSFRRNYPPRQGRVVAVGFPLLPRFWSATLANRPVAWLGVNKNFPLPGETRDSLILMSKALTGIRAFEVQPNFNIYEFFPNIEDTTANMSIEQMDSIREVVNYHGWTIGPTAPPINFIPSVWIDTLISYKHQSRTLGWISNEGIMNSLDQKLENAKQQLQKGNTKSASNIIQAFINEVEAQNGKHLTSEAYALLKYNAEYLLEKMGGK